jgi:hypothetical protein
VTTPGHSPALLASLPPVTRIAPGPVVMTALGAAAVRGGLSLPWFLAPCAAPDGVISVR